MPHTDVSRKPPQGQKSARRHLHRRKRSLSPRAIKENPRRSASIASGSHVHMNGRVYDPNLGRFLSVDPIFQFPNNTQSLNPYTYVLNSPLSMTDPTGLACDLEKGDACAEQETAKQESAKTPTRDKNGDGKASTIETAGGQVISPQNGGSVSIEGNTVADFGAKKDPSAIGGASERGKGVVNGLDGKKSEVEVVECKSGACSSVASPTEQDLERSRQVAALLNLALAKIRDSGDVKAIEGTYDISYQYVSNSRSDQDPFSATSSLSRDEKGNYIQSNKVLKAYNALFDARANPTAQLFAAIHEFGHYRSDQANFAAQFRNPRGRRAGMDQEYLASAFAYKVMQQAGYDSQNLKRNSPWYDEAHHREALRRVDQIN